MVMLGCKGFGKLNGSPRCTSTVSSPLSGTYLACSLGRENGSPRCTSTVSSPLSGTYLACSLGRENGRSVNSFKPDILP